MKYARLAVIFAFAIAPEAARAQAAASLSPAPRMQFFDNSGRPLAGGCVQTFQAGSSTPLATYNNAAGTANSNPVVLDAYGRADIWLGAGQAYKITVRAKGAAGCAGGGGTVLYTADNVIDQGFSLARSLQNGTLAIGLRNLPVTGSSGGIGIGNAMLSATEDGLYVSVNGAAPVLLSGGGGTGGSGSPGGPVTSIQYNNGSGFAGSPNLKWDNGGRVLIICPPAPPPNGCANTSGIEAPTFSSMATGSDPAFESASFHINGDGNGFFQGMNVTNTFNSLATGPTSAVQQAQGTFKITGAGDAGFQTVSMGLHAAPSTGLGGGVNQGSAMLSATLAGVYVSLNGAAPVLLGGGGGSGTPGAPATSIQYNNAGSFAGSANLTWDNTNAVVTLKLVNPSSSANASSINAPLFNGNVVAANSGQASGGDTFKNSDGSFHITVSGDGYFQGMNVTNTFNSLATGSTSAVQQASGTFKITGAGDAGFQSVGIGLRASALTGAGGGTGLGNAMLSATTAGLYLSLNGGAPVLISTTAGGGGGVPGAPSTSIQYNNAGTFAGSANLLWDNTNAIVTLTRVGITTAFISPLFTGNIGAGGQTAGADTFKNSDGSFHIDTTGKGFFQTLAVTTTISSSATGATLAFQVAGASINGQGDGSFRSLAVAGGAYGLNNAGALTVSSCTGCVGSAAGSNTQVQFNNGGIFGASANFTWNSGSSVLTVAGGNGTGYIGNTFTANAAGGAYGFQVVVGGVNKWQVDPNGNSSQTGSILTTPNGGTTVYGLTNAGALTVTSCTGCGGVTSIATGGNGLTFSAATGAVTGSLAQDIRTTASPTFAAMTVTGALVVSSCSGCGGGVTSLGTSGNGINVSAATGAVTLSLAQDLRTIAHPSFSALDVDNYFTCRATGTNPCITSGSGTWSINGNGTFLGQSVATGSNNGSAATAGQGATISNSGASIGMVVYDTGGHCNIGTGAGGSGIACSSDARLKHNIAAIGDGLGAVMKLKPSTYVMNGSGAPGVGFIAQDVRGVLPSLVTTDKGGYLELSEVGMIPYLVRSVQQLQEQLDTLRARVGVRLLNEQLSK